MLTDNQKQKLIQRAAKYYAKFLSELVPDWEINPNMKDTPIRVAKSFVIDLCKSLYDSPPAITAFDNVDKYDGIVLESNIPVKSMCAHHLAPIHGIAHVAYIPSPDGKIMGLSKLNRIVEYFSRMPAIQENLTMLIHNKINELCVGNLGVAVIIKAKHMCCSHRGVNHNSDMQTAKLSGNFFTKQEVREEFYNLVAYASKINI